MSINKLSSSPRSQQSSSSPSAVLLIFLLALVLSSKSTAFRHNSPPSSSRKNHYTRLLTHIYNQTDFNQDGKICFDDCYERLLYFYIHLNRRAAIEPPTRAALTDLYHTAGWNPVTKRLTLAEFSQLAHTVVGRAGIKFLVYKVIAVGVAPYVAWGVVDQVLPRVTTIVGEFPKDGDDDKSKQLWWIPSQRVCLSWATIVCSRQLPKLGIILINGLLERWQPFVRWFLPRPKDSDEDQCLDDVPVKED